MSCLFCVPAEHFRYTVFTEYVARLAERIAVRQQRAIRLGVVRDRNQFVTLIRVQGFEVHAHNRHGIRTRKTAKRFMTTTGG